MYLTGNVEMIAGGRIRYYRIRSAFPERDSSWKSCVSVVT
jgi:hypothetical protein